MKNSTLRLILDPLVGVMICVMAMQYPRAATASRPTPVIEQFAARAVSVSGDEDAGRIGIYIERWSSDGEVESLKAALADGDPDRAIDALTTRLRRVGVLLMPGVQGHGARVRERTPKNILFAREFDTPAGRRLVIASDERLGVGESQIQARKEVYQFTLIEIRFASDGTGVGKIADTGSVIYNAVTRAIEVRDYASAPPRLLDVKVDTPKREVVNASAR